MERNDFAKDFLGVGWKFPVEIDETTGRFKTSRYEEDIQEAVRIIIMTQKGERMMQPEFGCDVQTYAFDAVETSVLARMEEEILNALIRWEPRITQQEVHVERDSQHSERVNIHISYVVRSTNNPYNLVYPYYINEGFGE